MSDNTKYGTPKGMRDWLPHETLLRQKLIRLIESHPFRHWSIAEFDLRGD